MAEVSNPGATLQKIHHTVSEQMREFTDIFNNQICPELLRNNVMLYNGNMPQLPAHMHFMHDYFYREVIPYLQPVLIGQGTIMFLRDNRPYFAIKLFSKKVKDASGTKHQPTNICTVKLPTNDLPRVYRIAATDNLRHSFFSTIL